LAWTANEAPGDSSKHPKRRTILSGRRDSNPDQTSPSAVADCREKDADRTTHDDAKQRAVSASGDVVEAALARAIDAEVDARLPGWEGRIGLLAAELQARRRSRQGVASLETRAIRRGK
jgi:hypothetical protein